MHCEAGPSLACREAKKFGHLQILDEILVKISIKFVTHLGVESRPNIMNICDKSNQMRNYIFDKDYKEIPFLSTRKRL